MADHLPAARLQVEGDERRLIEEAQRDPRRFAALYERHFDRIYAWISARVRDRAEAEDITAAVFQKALEYLPKYEWRGVPYSAWLFQTAANAVRDRWQAAARLSELPPGEAVSPVDLEEAEHRARIFRLVRELPADQRRVIEMRFAAGKSIREIAVEMDRSEGAIKQLQFRGIETLRARLGEQHG
jgi:RNA polymerase sigma-70 factor (ECF subfamily)